MNNNNNNNTMMMANNGAPGRPQQQLPGGGPGGGPGVVGGGGPTSNITLQRTYALLPKFSAALSVFGSLYIIYDVLFIQTKRRQPQQHRQRGGGGRSVSGGRGGRSGGGGGAGIRNLSTYHRLLLSMSICDVLSSTAIFFTTWAMPAVGASNYAWMASGNRQTCTAQGFFIHFGTVGTILFNVSLSIYYFLSICKGWKSDRIMNGWIEPSMHILPFAFALITSVIGLYMEVFNGALYYCYISTIPKRCNESWRRSSETTMDAPDCVRGDNATLYRYICSTIPKIFALIVVTVIMWLCHRTVVMTERRSDRHNPSHIYQQQQASTTTNQQEGQQQGGSNSMRTSSAPAGGFFLRRMKGLGSSSSSSNNESSDQRQQQSSDNSNPQASSEDEAQQPSSTTSNDQQKQQQQQQQEQPRRNSRGFSLSFFDFSLRIMTSNFMADYTAGAGAGGAANNNNTIIKTKRSKRFARQSSLYVGALYLTLLPDIIHRTMQFFVSIRHPAIPIIIGLLSPLQGFLNALVYIRPRYLHAREVQRKQRQRERRRRLQLEEEHRRIQELQQPPSSSLDITSNFPSSPRHLYVQQSNKIVHTASDILKAAHSAIIEFDYSDDHVSDIEEDSENSGDDDVSSTVIEDGNKNTGTISMDLLSSKADTSGDEDDDDNVNRLVYSSSSSGEDDGGVDNDVEELQQQQQAQQLKQQLSNQRLVVSSMMEESFDDNDEQNHHAGGGGEGGFAVDDDDSASSQGIVDA